MFVARRELTFARGRFALIAAVVAMIAVLVGFLTGLTGGLATQNISGVLALPADRVVLAAPDSGSASYSDSTLTAAQAAHFTDAGLTVHPLGITQLKATRSDSSAAVAVFGTDATLFTGGAPAAGRVILSATAAHDLGARVGSTVHLGTTAYTVAAVRDDLWYSHTPVVQLGLADWQALQQRFGGAATTIGTALLVRGTADWSALDRAADTVSQTPLASLSALSTFRSEIGSLALMIVLLFGISALVVGAFFVVWGMQRRGDVAVLKALGASTRSLVVDALGQALVVLLIGVGIGLVLVVAGGIAASGALPFLLSPLTTLLPALAMIVLGLLGAAFSLRGVLTADPLTALGSLR